jgi:hypothetical protein
MDASSTYASTLSSYTSPVSVGSDANVVNESATTRTTSIATPAISAAQIESEKKLNCYKWCALILGVSTVVATVVAAIAYPLFAILATAFFAGTLFSALFYLDEDIRYNDNYGKSNLADHEVPSKPLPSPRSTGLAEAAAAASTHQPPSESSPLGSVNVPASVDTRSVQRTNSPRASSGGDGDILAHILGGEIPQQRVIPSVVDISDAAPAADQPESLAPSTNNQQALTKDDSLERAVNCC